MAGDGGRGSHDRAHEMRARPRPLAADEIAVRGGGAALARRHGLAIGAEAERAPGLAPFEARRREDAVEALRLGLALDEAAARDDPGQDAIRNLPPIGNLGGGPEILDPAVGAGADEDAVDR